MIIVLYIWASNCGRFIVQRSANLYILQKVIIVLYLGGVELWSLFYYSKVSKSILTKAIVLRCLYICLVDAGMLHATLFNILAQAIVLEQNDAPASHTEL